MEKKTVLHQEHINLGAKMVPFAGYSMPIQYSSILKEHKATRENIGIFDVSHMGQVFVSGDDALEYLQKILPQDVSKFEQNRAYYCQLPNNEGGLIDDLIVYKLEEKYLIILNASRLYEDIEWLNLNSKEFNVIIDNVSENYSMIALQGPNAHRLLTSIGIVEQPKFFSITKTQILNSDVLLARTGYTGEDGFEIIIKNQYAVDFWQNIIKAGEKFDITPVGLGARDTLRLEAALCLYGAELNETTTPIESGLGWSIPKDKKENYNGKDIILAQKLGEKPLRKKLFAFEMQDRVIARSHDEIYLNDKKIGEVTSGSISPVLGKNIGLCLLDMTDENNNCEESLNTSKKSIGTIVQIMVRNKLCNAQIVKKPFIEKKYAK